ncbi:MAG: Fe-S-cluster containining protein [Bradymonadia bacterium]|jgi:Fe-S-cluster containining protein
MLPLIQNLQHRRALDAIDDAFAGPNEAPACATGCDACCHGPFDVSSSDLWSLLEALVELELGVRGDALRRIKAAARVQRGHLAWTQEACPSLETVGEDAFDAMCDALVEAPCPLLVDNRCAVYASRPEPCRFRGRVWRDNDEELDMDCPVGLNDHLQTLEVPYLDLAETLARVESRSRGAVNGRVERTSIALGLDHLLRSRGSTKRPSTAQSDATPVPETSESAS